MEGELNHRVEKMRRRIEKLEDEFDKVDEFKDLLNELNEIKVKIYASGVFSDNEEFKEIKTEDIKYLLVSFYQGEVIQKFNENRENILALALQFYKEFYNILNKYEYLTKERKEYYKKISGESDEDDKENVDKKPDLEELSKERDEKIMAFKYKKAISEKLKKIEKEGDYDNSRDFWISYLEIGWLKMIENIKMIKMEIDSIKYIKNQKKTGEYDLLIEMDKQNISKKMEILQIKSPDDLNKLDPNNKLTKNLNVINTSSNPNCNDCLPGKTHNHHMHNSNDPNTMHTIPTLDYYIERQINARDYVFRPNNLPTMTLDEFAEKEKVKMDEAKVMEEEAKKNQPNEDSDDEDVADFKTYKAREWDDWKDSVEKGGGNKKKR